MALVNQAIARTPNDPVLHEVRALILFARGQYKPAAAAIYAVLSVGPGWDWPTLRGFYADPSEYTRQLRTLEQNCSTHPELPEIHFLLAYHYMSGGQIEGAAAEFQEAIRLNPHDQLSTQLLAGLTKGAQEVESTASQRPVPATPVSVASLLGTWEAIRPDGASFKFRLSDDATYLWQYTQDGRSPQHFRGTYTVADNLLILKCDGNPTMIGQVAVLDTDHFNFKLAGANPNDPGITFSSASAIRAARSSGVEQPEVR